MKSKYTICIALMVLLIPFFGNIEHAFSQTILSLNSRSEGNLRNPLSQNASNILSSPYLKTTTHEGWSFSLGWFRPFDIKDLEEGFFSMQYAKNNLALNSAIWQSGDFLYKETVFQLGVQATIKAFSFGLKPQLRQLSILGYPNTTVYDLQAFIGVELTKNWFYYGLIYWQPSTSTVLDQRIMQNQSAVVFGFHYSMSSSYALATEISNDKLNGLDVRFAQKLNIIKNTLQLSTGYDLLREMPTVGLAIQVNKLSVQLHYSFHPYLSQSTGAALNYHFPSKMPSH